MSSSETFGPIRSLLWPVYRSELKRFVPMLLIFFLISFNYNILRATKDALVVTAPASGAEALPFIKVWAILPCAFLMTFLFTRVCNRFSKEKVFYVMMSIFVLFFILFTFVLYPCREFLHPNQTADTLQALLPVGFKGLIAMFRNWTFTLFYIMSEMWSTIIMTVLFWGFANDVTSVKDAKRFYGLLGISANGSGIVAGLVAAWLSSPVFYSFIPFGVNAWDQSVLFLNSLIILCGISCMMLFRMLHSQGLGYQRYDAKTSEQAPELIKMGLRKNFTYLAKSKYLICIAVVVVMYNIAINLVEVIWKDQVKQLYPNPNDFNVYMGQVLTAIGVLATTTSIFVSGNIIRRFSWTASALVPPVIILSTGIGFFFFLLFKDSSLGAIAAVFGSTPLALGVFFGSLQNCLSRASKYTLFDATKELSFIPLSQECKLKGKAAIDGVGSRLGKSGGSIIHQGLLLFFGSVSLSTPFVGIILLFVIGGWILAVRALGKKFTELTSRHETLNVAEEEEAPPAPVVV
jgi:ATP:ADP antiporter, AAA family